MFNVALNTVEWNEMSHLYKNFNKSIENKLNALAMLASI